MKGRWGEHRPFFTFSCDERASIGVSGTDGSKAKDVRRTRIMHSHERSDLGRNRAGIETMPQDYPSFWAACGKSPPEEEAADADAKPVGSLSDFDT
jgi:hypothetical protein